MRLSSDWLEFELSVKGYQFPESADGWLNIRIRLSHARKRWSQWEKLDPSLETVEVQRLIEWLEEIAAHAEVFKNWCSERLTSRIFFTEPNLSFEVLSGSHAGKALTFRVYLAAEYLPPVRNDLNGVMLNEEDDPAEVWIDFPAEASDLQQATFSLTQQLARFPVRTEVPNHPTSQSQGD